MHHNFNFKDVLAISSRPSWAIEDVLPPGAKLDFGRRFMPENLARTATSPFLDDEEARILNQIRGHEYLALFGLVEEFILPFVLDHARTQLSGDDHRVRAMLQFASEEAKHIHLFKEFHRRFTEGFSVPCDVIGPPEAIAAEILGHDPLAVALVILHLEWMTQSHYVDSVKDDGDLDPLFKSLLKYHWMEEAQHAMLDTLMIAELTDGLPEAEVVAAVDGYLEIGGAFDGLLKQQAAFDLDALEKASGRTLGEAERAKLHEQQHQAQRWTFLGSGIGHPNFLGTIGQISPASRKRLEEIVPVFA